MTLYVRHVTVSTLIKGPLSGQCPWCVEIQLRLSSIECKSDRQYKLLQTLEAEANMIHLEGTVHIS